MFILCTLTKVLFHFKAYREIKMLNLKI